MSNKDNNTLLIFGLGFTARACVNLLDKNHWRVFGTTRSEPGATALGGDGLNGLVFEGGIEPTPEVQSAVAEASHILVSIPPDLNGDPVLNALGDTIRTAQHLQWIGYLSTIGVYGDHDGAWIDETTPASPQSQRSKRRLAAERAWQDLVENQHISLQIFRLAGIYGPGRSAVERVKSGRAQAINKEGQVFNRTHVADAAAAIVAAMTGRGRHQIYNLTDDLPAPPQDPLNFAADLLNLPRPPETAFEDAELSEMARSFYSENKRVRNSRMREDLGIDLRYPTFREGLSAIAEKA